MITISRAGLRRLRSVFRRPVLGLPARGPAPTLVLRVRDGRLHAHFRAADLAVEHALPGSHGPADPVALPLEALAELEGGGEAPVSLEVEAPGRVLARWADCGIPRRKEYAAAVPPPEDWPVTPTFSGAYPAGLLEALAEAAATVGERSARYDLTLLRLSGARGEVAATDGRQVLIHAGLAFPWADDLLVRTAPLLAARELTRDAEVHLARTATQVVIRAGDWTVWLTIQAGGRFPDVSRAVPDASAAATRLDLDPGDARFLAGALARLPGGGEPHAPVTLDLNGRVAVRAGSGDGSPPTELVLARSAYAGAPLRLCCDRAYLGRAARLGCGAIEVQGADQPLVGRSGGRTYAWQPLSADGAIGPDDDAVRVESTGAGPMATPARAVPGDVTPKPKEKSPGVEKSTVPADPTAAKSPVGLAAVLQEAEALNQLLGAVKARAGRLVVALRRQRRQSRLVRETLRSLKQLQLQDVPE